MVQGCHQLPSEHTEGLWPVHDPCAAAYRQDVGTVASVEDMNIDAKQQSSKGSRLAFNSGSETKNRYFSLFYTAEDNPRIAFEFLECRM